jgi:hypothetical protein
MSLSVKTIILFFQVVICFVVDVTHCDAPVTALLDAFNMAQEFLVGYREATCSKPQACKLKPS